VHGSLPSGGFFYGAQSRRPMGALRISARKILVFLDFAKNLSFVGGHFLVFLIENVKPLGDIRFIFLNGLTFQFR
jgi:hypothetical protein